MYPPIFVQPLLQIVIEKLANLALGNWYGLVNFKKLEHHLLLIQGVIQHAEDRQMRDYRVMYWSFRHWLFTLQCIAYAADDLLDQIHTEDLRRQTRKKVISLSPFDSFKTYLELKDIQKRIGDLASEIPSLGLRNDVLYRPKFETGIGVSESQQVYGRGEDVQMIIETLMNPTSSSSSSNLRSTVSVLPIVGICGIGKTTVAQLVYNNPDIQNHFDLRIWIAVREDFNVTKLIRDILQYTGQENTFGCQLPQLGILQSRLQESLSGRKYLLVLDNIQNEDEAEWCKLREPLSGGIRGSKILVTTPSETVARLMGTSLNSYTLQALPTDACWALFREFAFPEGGGGEAYPILNEIGLDIVRRSEGIPLAAKVFGSLLRSDRDEREWRLVSEWLSRRGRESCMHNVRMILIFKILPHKKWCFLSCSVFPETYEINREKLVHQWIAEGLIPSPGDGTCKKMEDIGNEYFNDFLQMSLFEGVSNCEDGRIEDFRMKLLIRNPVPVRIYPGEVELFSETGRRATIVCNELSSTALDRLRMRKLRSLYLIYRGNDITKMIQSLFKSLRHVRVLNLSNCGITTLHKSVGDLIYLRYLDLSNNLMSRLPETICDLLNLQSLDLSSCDALEVLPSNIANLINLRHLNIEDCVSLSWMPPNIGKLRNLQTLPIFILGQDLEQSLYQLVHLDLRGGLKIKQLENAGNYVPDVCLEYKQLHTLSLSWGDDNEGKVGRNAPRQDPQRNHSHNAENLINHLIPNRNLSVLRINGYSGTMFPQWFNKLMLLNLTKLVLVNCRRCETLPTLGQLQFLKYLEMEGMDEVVKIADEFYGREGKTKPFPSLIELILKDIPNLRSWEGVDSLEIFPCLQKLSIMKCPRLISMPRFPLLEHLNMHDCDDKILWSVSELNSLSTFVIDVCPLAYFIPRALLSNNSNLTLLKISSCPKFNTLPATVGTLTSLRSLSICFCEVLETLPREMLNLTNLENLELIECPSLISLPDESIQGLKSLRSLSIENCSSLASLPLTLGKLTALEHLTIMYCPNLAYLPDVVHEFQALHSLNIFDCISLESLPSGLGRVSSLHNLAIHGCPEIKELPDWIGNLVSLRSLAISECENIKLLPDGMQRLQELQHLSIRDCPDLEVRCRKDTGEDWHKISHIPFKYVGSSNAAASSSSS